MTIKQELIELDPKQLEANIVNIERSLNEIGIRNTKENIIYLSLVIILQQIQNELNKEQILQNFGQLYDLIDRNFVIK